MALRLNLLVRKPLGVVLSALLLSGCTYTMDTSGPNAGQGVLVVDAPGVIPLSEPDALAAAAGAIPASGTFAGIGSSLNNPENRCGSQIRLSRFVVDGDRVRFGGFRGTITPQGRVDMQMGSTFIIGRFVNDTFQGHTWAPPPGCNYELILNRVS